MASAPTLAVSEIPDLPVTPVNLAAEKETLGILIESSEIRAAALAEGLNIHDFFLADHRRVFAAILALKSEEAPIDFITVCDKLGKPDDAALVASLISGAVVVRSHALAYVRILKKKRRLRFLGELADWLTAAVNQVNSDPDQLTQTILAKLGTAK